MNKYIFEANELPEGEKVYLRKNIFGWKVISPIENEDGSYNWFNLITGGWENLLFTLFILLLLGLFYLAWKEVADQAAACYARNTTIINNVVRKSIDWSAVNLTP